MEKWHWSRGFSACLLFSPANYHSNTDPPAVMSLSLGACGTTDQTVHYYIFLLKLGASFSTQIFAGYRKRKCFCYYYIAIYFRVLIYSPRLHKNQKLITGNYTINSFLLFHAAKTIKFPLQIIYMLECRTHAKS
jgi:hypothetical protein